LSPQKAFGARIRALRLAADVTQEELAERCGLFRTYLSRIENGSANPTLTMIHALATSLQVDVRELFEPVLARKEPQHKSKARSPAGASRGRVR
jgi:transcriptional regulator with XRE-family HTH domain